MKINAKDLCSIKDIQELKSVDSINNILKVINSEITPMSVTAQTYEELFSVIAVLKKQWNNFNSDVYFKNENVKMIYSLLYARPEVRNINIGYEHSEYHNSDYPQNEKGYEQFEKKYKKFDFSSEYKKAEVYFNSDSFYSASYASSLPQIPFSSRKSLVLIRYFSIIFTGL